MTTQIIVALVAILLAAPLLQAIADAWPSIIGAITGAL